MCQRCHSQRRTAGEEAPPMPEKDERQAEGRQDPRRDVDDLIFCSDTENWVSER